MPDFKPGDKVRLKKKIISREGQDITPLVSLAPHAAEDFEVLSVRGKDPHKGRLIELKVPSRGGPCLAWGFWLEYAEPLTPFQSDLRAYITQELGSA